MKIFKRNGEVLPAGVPFELEQPIEVPEEHEVDGQIVVVMVPAFGKVAYPWNWLDLADAADLAALHITVEEVADVEPVPAQISDRQFFQQLAIAGTISQEDALAAVKIGAIPPSLAAIVDAISDDLQRFAANMLLAGATIFERSHPLTASIGAAQGMTEDQIDAFFRAAARL